MDTSLEKCPNCLMHGWTPVEDELKLQLCANCELIKYCGKDCQTEHWKNVHKKHCKYFKDPSMERQWEHKVYNCPICLQAAVVGPSQLRQPDNPNYECIFECVMNLPPPLVHPHPFPVAGHPGDTMEKVIIVLWQLLQKFVLTQPWTENWHKAFQNVFLELASKTIYIWGARKVSPEMSFNLVAAQLLSVNLDDIQKEVEKNEGTEDPFQLWKTITLVNGLIRYMGHSRYLQVLIDPLSDIPAEFQALISQALSTNDKFIATVNKVLDALDTQVIPFKDVLEIICDGSFMMTCICSENINDAKEGASADNSVSDVEGEVLFNCLYMGICCLAASNCREVAVSRERDVFEFDAAMVAVIQARCVAICDKCFRMPPVKDIHRCSGCLSVQYCSEKCLKDDRPIHGLVCKKDMEERKVKFGKSGRRKMARDDLEKLQKRGADNVDIQKATKLMARMRFKNSDNVEDVNDHVPS